MKKTEKKIAGHKITLKTGTTYRASRPMAARGVKVYPVTITELPGGHLAHRVDGLDYDKANDLINAFNNGWCSYAGRVW